MKLPRRKPAANRRRVVLYSGGQERRNALIHEALLELALRRHGDSVAPRMTYLPYSMRARVRSFAASSAATALLEVRRSTVSRPTIRR